MTHTRSSLILKTNNSQSRPAESVTCSKYNQADETMINVMTECIALQDARRCTHFDEEYPIKLLVEKPAEVINYWVKLIFNRDWLCMINRLSVRIQRQQQMSASLFNIQWPFVLELRTHVAGRTTKRWLFELCNFIYCSQLESWINFQFLINVCAVLSCRFHFYFKLFCQTFGSFDLFWPGFTDVYIVICSPYNSV